MALASLATLDVAPIPSLSDEINQIRMDTAKVVSEHIIPKEEVLMGQTTDDERQALIYDLQTYVKESSLWAPHLPKEYGGMGIGILGQAYMLEIISWSPFATPIFGIEQHTAGNQTLLVQYGTDEQKQQFLEPTVAGDTSSCFSMTEPDASGSDARTLRTTAVRDGDEWVINGHKWFTANGVNADWALVMCRVEEQGKPSDKMTMIIVPTDTKGFKVERTVPVWGHLTGDHCEITYTDVRVPVANQLGEIGAGDAAAGEWLATSAVYQCMTCVGQMWRAFDLMIKRSTERMVKDGLLQDKQFIQGFMADSYMDIQASRQLCIHSAEVMEGGGDRSTAIATMKVFVPSALHRVVDRSIQVHGALGVSGDTPLANMYMDARTLRIANGTDEMHKLQIAKNVFAHYHEIGESWDFGTA